RRSVVFIAFVAEEMGLLGSMHFVEHPPIAMEHVVAMVNLDMIGRLRAQEGVSLEGAATAPEWRARVDEANTEKLKVTGSPALMEDSDPAPFYHRGLPIIFFFPALHPEYHCHTDVADLINGDGIAQVARLALRVPRATADNSTPHAGLTFAQVKVV